MPGSLDSCINSVYEPGNIPASAGTPPVRVLLKDALEAAIAEAASATETQGGALGNAPIDAAMSEAATASDALSVTMAATPWTLVGSWTWSTNVANVDFTGLNRSEIRVVIKGITTSVSGQRQLLVSTDNGSTFLTTSGDYISVSPTVGAESNTTSITFHATGATAARSGEIIISNCNLTTPKLAQRQTATDQFTILIPTASALNAVRVTNSAGGNLTAGSIYVYTRW